MGGDVIPQMIAIASALFISLLVKISFVFATSSLFFRPTGKTN
jgi:hypothetical protein